MSTIEVIPDGRYYTVVDHVLETGSYCMNYTTALQIAEDFAAGNHDWWFADHAAYVKATKNPPA